MQDPQLIGAQLEQAFHKIHLENMQGIPILNPAIRVEALGFQLYEGRVLGIIITPWLMNVVLLPVEGEDWSHMALGDKRPHKFVSMTYKFMLNEIDGIGRCQTNSLYSPMRDFISHEQALVVAQNFLDDLMVDRALSEEERVDEDLLGRVMRGEDTSDVNLDDFDTIQPMSAESQTAAGEAQIPVTLADNKISRRNLLCGKLRG